MSVSSKKSTTILQQCQNGHSAQFLSPDEVSNYLLHADTTLLTYLSHTCNTLEGKFFETTGFSAKLIASCTKSSYYNIAT